MCTANFSNAISNIVFLVICFQENDKPRVTEQKNSKKASFPTPEEAKNSYLLVSSVVTSSDNSSQLDEPAADVTPLCVKCRTQEFVNLAGAKILTDKFILRIDEYSLKVFPVAFAMYNAFYWMDYLWKDIGTCFRLLLTRKLISKLLELETVRRD